MQNYLFTPLPATEHIFSYEGAVQAHLKTLGLSLLFFMGFNYFATSVFKYWSPDFYAKHREDTKKQQAVVAMIISCVHHVITCVTAVYTLFIMPPQDPPMRFLFSPNKQNLDYYPITSQQCMFTLAYLVYDLFLQTIVIEDFSQLGYQQHFHHVFASTILVVGCLGGMHQPKLMVVVLMCELSTIFLHIREIKGKTTWKGIFATLNTGIFFICYTLVRVVLFPFAIYAHFKLATLYDFSKTSWFHQFSYWFNLGCFFLIYMLNMFWYKIILKSVKNMIFKKPVDGFQKYEDEKNKLTSDDSAAENKI